MSEQAAKRRRIRKGKGKGKGKGGKSRKGTGKGKNEDADTVAEPPVLPLVRPPVVRNPNGFDIGTPSSPMFHFAVLQRSADRPSGYKVICRLHAPQISMRGRGEDELPCGREQRAASNTDAAMATCFKSLLEWCLQCDRGDDRNHHMSRNNFPPVDSHNDEQTLLDNVAGLCGRVRATGLPPHLAGRWL